jgi:hypothetical protein
MNVGEIIARSGTRQLIYAGKNGKVDSGYIRDGENNWGPYPIASIAARGEWIPVSSIKGWF